MSRLFIAVISGVVILSSLSGNAENRCESVFRSVGGGGSQERQSVFFTAREFALNARQKIALRALARLKGDEIDRTVASAAAAKLRSYESVRTGELSRFEIEDANAIRDALEFTLQTFRSPGDEALRSAVMAKLAAHPLADSKTIDALMPIVRGSRALRTSETREAAEAIVRIHANLGDRSSDVILTARNDARKFGSVELIRNLREAKIVSIKPLSNGNVNATVIVAFQQPTGEVVRGVFKSFVGEHTADIDQVLFTREVHAFDFFNEFFAHPQISIPETIEVVLRHEGVSYGPGSLQLFAEGAVTANAFYGGAAPAKSWKEYARIWSVQRKDSRWKDIAAWIRVFDWAMGNSDRFPNSHHGAGNPNNLMMKESAGAGSPLLAILIDNGNGRNPRAWGEFDQRDLPSTSEFPVELRKKILTFNDEKLREIRRASDDVLSPEGVNELVARLRRLREIVEASP